MIICYLTPFYPPNFVGGAEISLSLLVNSLTKKGVKIIVFTPNYEKQTEITKGNPTIYKINWRKKGIFSINNPLAYRKVWQFIKENNLKPDLIDSYNWHPLAKYLGQKLKTPYIISLRDATSLCDVRVDLHPREYSGIDYFKLRFKTYGFSLAQIAYGLYGKWLTRESLQAIRKANFVTYASQAVADIYKKFNKNGKVINSIALADNEKIENVSLKGIDFQKDKIFVYAGRLSKGKGVKFLLDAVKQILQKRNDIKFIFLGDGEFKNFFNHPHVLWLGKKQRHFVLSVFQKATAVIVPSIIFEAFPRSGVEAISLGTPVIGTNAGGIPEAVGECGIIVSSNNVEQLVTAIIKMADRNMKLLLKNKMKQKAKNYTAEKISQKILKIYQPLLS